MSKHQLYKNLSRVCIVYLFVYCVYASSKCSNAFLITGSPPIFVGERRSGINVRRARLHSIVTREPSGGGARVSWDLGQISHMAEVANATSPVENV